MEQWYNEPSVPTLPYGDNVKSFLPKLAAFCFFYVHLLSATSFAAEYPESFLEYGMHMGELFLRETSPNQRVVTIESLANDPASVYAFKKYLVDNATDAQIDTLLRSIDPLLQSLAPSPVTYKVPGSLKSAVTAGIWFAFNVAVQGWYGGEDEVGKKNFENNLPLLNNLFLLMIGISAIGDAMVFGDEAGPFFDHRRTAQNSRAFLEGIRTSLREVKDSPDNPVNPDQSRQRMLLDWLVEISEPLRASQETMNSYSNVERSKQSFDVSMEISGFLAKIFYKVELKKFENTLKKQAKLMTGAERRALIEQVHSLGYQVAIGGSAKISDSQENALNDLFSTFAKENPDISFASVLEGMKARQAQTTFVHKKLNSFQFLKKAQFWLGASLVGMWGMMSNLGYDPREGLDKIIPFLNFSVIDVVRSIWPTYAKGFLAALGVTFAIEVLFYPYRSKRERTLSVNNPVVPKDEWTIAERLAFQSISNRSTSRDVSDEQHAKIAGVVDEAYSILARRKLQPYMPENLGEGFRASCKRAGLRMLFNL